MVRRIDGRWLDRFLREEVTGPWGLDFALGLHAEEQARAAELEYGNPAWVSEMLGEPGSLRAMTVHQARPTVHYT